MDSSWLRRVGGAVLLAGAMVMATGSPVVAQVGTVPINDDHVPTTAQEFRPHECDGPLSDLPDDQDGWHLLLPAASGDSFVSLTLSFDTPGGEVVATIVSTDPANPSTGPGWSGYLDGMHGWVVTDAGWTLTAGEAVVQNPGRQDFFNLSHTCPGTPPSPSPSPSASPSASPTPSPSMSPTPTPGQTTGQPAPSPTRTPGLPVSGSRVGGAILVGLGLLGSGGVLLMVLRRRTWPEGTGS